ncbi:MAG TPA: EAL domain-containing protein [Allosphingosinicella sp.]|jgi:EAL domain-containing protein (putative c-di-GMP-specific phosphodiesterase class I)/CHASE2 domain-containing sensor protein
MRPVPAPARAFARLAAPLAAAAVAGLLLLETGLGIGLDRRLSEWRDAWRERPASGEIHIVEIDARSIDAIRQWPLPRSLHGRAVDRLREAGARTIALDVDFSSRSIPAEDAAFGAALARAGGAVILPTFTQPAGHGSAQAIDSAPIPALGDHAFLATANVLPDEDGALRFMPLGGETFGVPRPSLAAMIAETTENAADSFAIDYAIDPASVPRHSFIDLIEGRVPAAALAGRRVVIGSTAVENGDHYAVPRHGFLPGVVIQAVAAETLMAGSSRLPANGALPLVLALLLSAAATVRGPSRLGIAALAAGAALAPALALAADRTLAVSFDIAPALGAIAVAALGSAAALRRRRERHQARSDAATGLANLFALEEAARGAGTVEIVVARIAGFASLAAALGPEATAKLVAALAQRLALGTGGTVIYRTDEASLAWIAGSAAVSLDGLAALARDQEAEGRRVEVPLHFGLAAGDGAAAGQLAANAALAASQAERSGARMSRFTEKDSEEVSRNLALMGELDEAFASGAIRNFYQPKLDLAADRIVAVEALVRWQHPERGLIPPDAFLPLIEEHGRGRDLTRHVLREALADALAWRDAGLDLGVAVNVGASLLGEGEFMAELRDIVRAGRLPPNRLTIEVTETAAMDDPEAAIAALDAWRALGAGVSIDDFGTGQSSLGYIRMLPATELKIDRSFVGDIGTSPRNAIMVRSTVAMAHELGLEVVAEGVEDESCLDALRVMGCDLAQGYHIGRPQPAAGIADLARSWGSEKRRAAAGS